MTRSTVRSLLVSTIAACAVAVGLTAPGVADFNGDMCNRGAACFNWDEDICRDALGTPVSPTDSGCVGTVCGPCRTVACTPVSGVSGLACACKLTQPMVGPAPCQTCLGLDGEGAIVSISCKDNGCTPAHLCQVKVPPGLGIAECSCHD